VEVLLVVRVVKIVELLLVVREVKIMEVLLVVRVISIVEANNQQYFHYLYHSNKQ
jgi:hypothetical protein